MTREELRAHLVTLFLFSLPVGLVALILTFPRFFLFLVLTAVAAVAYVRLHTAVAEWLTGRS